MLDRGVTSAPALVVVEGTGSFGAILIERLQAAGTRGRRSGEGAAGPRRGTGKSDELDAVWIARAVLGLALTDLGTPRALSTDRAQVATRVLVVAREQMTGEWTRAVNALTASVRTIDLGIDARKPLTARQIGTIARWRNRDEDLTIATCRHEAVRLAQLIRTLDCDLAGKRAGITELTRYETPQLLEPTGVGTVVAAERADRMVVSWRFVPTRLWLRSRAPAQFQRRLATPPRTD